MICGCSVIRCNYGMVEKDDRLKASRTTRLKNLTEKKNERGELEPDEEKELQRLISLLASPEQAVQ